jgi:hypothetical protein
VEADSVKPIKSDRHFFFDSTAGLLLGILAILILVLVAIALTVALVGSGYHPPGATEAAAALRPATGPPLW